MGHLAQSASSQDTPDSYLLMKVKVTLFTALLIRAFLGLSPTHFLSADSLSPPHLQSLSEINSIYLMEFLIMVNVFSCECSPYGICRKHV